MTSTPNDGRTMRWNPELGGDTPDYSREILAAIDADARDCQTRNGCASDGLQLWELSHLVAEDLSDALDELVSDGVLVYCDGYYRRADVGMVAL